MSTPITFSGSPMDRAALQRRDPNWLKGLLEDDASRFLPLYKLDPLVKQASSARWPGPGASC